MRELKADLHVHTCLSPCGELEMLPTAIARRAKEQGLDMIAICDHNSVGNALAVARAGERESLSVIPGIEITTREEVHILGLFGTEEGLGGLQALIDETLSGENDADVFGPQVIVDEQDQPTALDPALLIGATTLKLEETVDAIHEHGGLAIASHVDREGFGLLGQLGFIPPGLELDALEVSPRAALADWRNRWTDYPVITSSDAHRLEDIGRSRTTFLLEEASLEEIGKALSGEGGRKVVIG